MNEYRLLDSGNGCKLEQVGPYRLVRQALNAIWLPKLPKAEWDQADSVFLRDSSGHGTWKGRKLPPQWEAEYAGLTMRVKPTDFGHLGFFAEQYENWDFYHRFIPKIGADAKTLNLFAYSGLGSLAMAQAGAQACHLDAARGMVEWAKENLSLNPTIPDRIRWIVDDVMKFVLREQRRNSQYQGIALDPPSFGRGAQAQVWKIEEDLPKLLSVCSQLLDCNRPHFVILSCHSNGFTPIVLERLLREYFGPAGRIECREMTIPEASGGELPAGISARLVVE